MNRFLDMKMAALSAVVLSGAALVAAQPARAFDDVRTVQGQTFWTGNPGAIDPGSFFASGQYRFDPNNYLSYEAEEDNQDYRDVVYADHPGRARCVIRKRVINSEWEFEHPYLMVCRP